MTNIRRNSIDLNSVSIAYPVRFGTRSNMSSGLSRLFGFESDKSAKTIYLRALRDINLNIQNGERVGIIGKNGAGKSTLLKTIGGVLHPVHGTISINGNVQSLFDIGVGLELRATGRENVLFRGLLQGLSPKVIRARENEIIEFANLGKLIDFPVNSYSSGMIVRLAFSIAAFLEGEILLVDEIFAAGDANFQEKANEKMRSIVNNAGIFVFTSHNLSLVSELCSRGIYLKNGDIAYDGPIDEAIEHYISDTK